MVCMLLSYVYALCLATNRQRRKLDFPIYITLPYSPPRVRVRLFSVDSIVTTAAAPLHKHIY